MRSQPLYNRFMKLAPYFLAAVFIIQAVFSRHLDSWVHPVPFESGQVQHMDKRTASTVRALAFLGGFKVLVGHLFWIQVIQYYGDADNSLDRYSKLYDYCNLASDLNPQFVPIYTYGAAALAFHLKRIGQAEELLQKGISNNPKENRLKFMMAAILYQHAENYQRVIPFLEAQLATGDAPDMLVNILANTYMKVNRFNDAIRLWKKILRVSDTDQQKIEAGEKLQEIYNTLKKSGQNTQAKGETKP